MRIALLLGAMSAFGLAAPSTAQAQYGQSYRGYYQTPNYGFSSYGYGSYYPGYSIYNRGHFDYVPGHYDRHYNHYHYVPPHTDYHIGGQRYEVIPGRFGPTLSPFSHRH